MECDLAGGPAVKLAPRRERHEVIDDQDLAVHNWRVAQLSRLGVPSSVAQAVADEVDWHQVGELVQMGCPPRVALRIVR
jgi:sirohydrochlorin ferrochelatase